MKKSELRQIIREEISRLNEAREIKYGQQFELISVLFYTHKGGRYLSTTHDVQLPMNTSIKTFADLKTVKSFLRSHHGGYVEFHLTYGDPRTGRTLVATYDMNNLPDAFVIPGNAFKYTSFKR